MDHFPGNWGNPLYNSKDQIISFQNINDLNTFNGGGGGVKNGGVASAAGPISHTQQPIVTGTSVLGIKFNGGIMLAADTLASYGSLAQVRDMKRLAKFGENTIIGAGGDMSDWQHLQRVIQDEIISEYYNDDGHSLHPEHIHEFLARVMYERRTKNDPLWNYLVVGGVKNGKSFLGYVDYQGTTYQSSTIATGYGAYIAQPLLRNAVEGKEDSLTQSQAAKILDDSMRVLFYRDARSINKIQRATVTAAGVEITEPYSVDTEWGFADRIRGYGAIYE